jgi:hypothetical protein
MRARAQDFETGSGGQPQDGQEVTFQYTAYNENGSRIDSSYSKGRPASTRLGINGLIPGAQSLFCHRAVKVLVPCMRPAEALSQSAGEQR